MASDGARRFPFEWEPTVRHAARLAGITPRNAWVEIKGGIFTARFGPWRVRTPVTNIEGTEITGPYSLAKVAGGPRVSFADRGLTFAGTTRRGLCLRFREPVTGIDPFGLFRHPGLTVTVADPRDLASAIEQQR